MYINSPSRNELSQIRFMSFHVQLYVFMGRHIDKPIEGQTVRAKLMVFRKPFTVHRHKARW